jgi:uncharacterized membrane protein
MILVQTAFLFAFQLIVQKDLGATEAISLSFEKVKENFWQFFLFGFVLWLIYWAGASVTIGWLVTTPLGLAASAVAYRDVFEPIPPAETAEGYEQD